VEPRQARPGVRDIEEFAVTSEKTTQVESHQRSGERTDRPQELRSIEVWARSAPIRLAGYEDDLAEPHILQGVD
jgi:hypothetical protein